MDRKSGSAFPSNKETEDALQSKDILRFRRVEMTVATSAFGSILTVAVVCGCFYFACARQNRKSRREFWQRKGCANVNSPSNMLITPYPTNPDLGIQDGRHVINMNYTGSAPQAPSMIYSCDPVTPSYSYQQNSTNSMSYDHLSFSNDSILLIEDGDKVQMMLSNAAKIKEKLKISQPPPKSHFNMD